MGFRINLNQKKYPMLSPLSAYLNSIGCHPLLTPVQELTLGRTVQTMIGIQERHRLIDGLETAPTFSKQDQRLIRLGERAKDQMIVANLRLVVNMSKRYQGKGLELLDLIQEGTLGLCRAVEKYDPTRGNRFSTYAYWWIRQGLNRALSTQSRTIRIPVNVNEQLTQLRAARATLLQFHGQAATTPQLAAQLGLSVLQVEALQGCELRSGTVSLQGDVHALLDPSDLLNVLPSAEASPLERAEQAERLDMVWVLLDQAQLSPRERSVVLLRFGLDQNHQWRTLVDVAEQLGCSREYCRLVVQRALRKMRKIGLQSGLVEIA